MDRPNIVLVTVECWRGDHLGPLTPNLSKLAQEAAVFTSAYAAGGWTLPSMTALMSSAYASMFGGPTVALASPERQILAECLLRSGYWTAGFAANVICGSLNGFHRGFGRFRDERKTLTSECRAYAEAKISWRKLREDGVSPRSMDTLAEASQVTESGLQWIEQLGSGGPFFLWLHYMEPHWPCLTPAAEELTPRELELAWKDRVAVQNEVIPRKGRFDAGEEMGLRWVDRYQRALTVADAEIGKLLAVLRNRSDWDRTIVVATGDHGEEFFEHGSWHHAWNQLHREGIQVPLIVRMPGLAPVRVPQAVSNMDIAPTLLELAGASQQPGIAAMMGRSLRPLMAGGELADRPVYSEMLAHRDSFSYRLAVLDGYWKYIYDLDDPHGSKLFHLTQDPGERFNLREDRPDVFRSFERMRFAHVTLGLTQLMTKLATEPAALEMDPVMREQMIALGYMEAS